MQSRFAIAITCAALLFASACARKRAAAVRSPTPAPTTAPAKAPTTHSRSAPVTTGPAEFGLASWYGRPFDGRMAANGEIYDMEKLTAAHRTLPFNTWVRVTNLANNKSVDVRIIDRGPFVEGRVIDLSHAAAQLVDMIGPGVVNVRLDIIDAPLPGPDGNIYSVQAGIYPDQARAERVRASLETKFGAARLVFKDGKPPSWRVLVGVEESMASANALARQIQAQVGSGFVVRLDQFPPSPAPSRPVANNP